MKRILYEPLKAHLPKKEFTLLAGARQTGKTTLLRQLETYCKEEGIPSVFLNLENKNILSELDGDPLNVLNYLPVSDQRSVVFVDEVQYLSDPSNFLKLLYDEHVDQLKIVATGSSAFYLDDVFRDSLAGRKRMFRLLTCSFEEYLQLAGHNELLAEMNRIIKNKNAKTAQLSYLKNEWETYMLYGGYPAVVTEPDPREKIERLKELRDSYIKRDILESGIRDQIAFYNLFQLIAGQNDLVNKNELSRTLGIKTGTVDNYIGVLRKCFHIALVKPFYKNLRKELTKMPKAFILDTGLRNCLINNFQKPGLRLDKGELWETMYYRVLADGHDIDDIYFWRTTAGNEVDFILPRVATPYAVETKYHAANKKPSKYKKFQKTYPDIPLQFVWMEPFDEDFFRRMCRRET